MSSSALVDLFVEDSAHEALLRALVRRIAVEEGLTVIVRIRSAQGGRGRVLGELRNYFVLLQKGLLDQPRLIVAAIDANCSRLAAKSSEIAEAAPEPYRTLLVTACPDPHVERWYMADLSSFHQVVGATPRIRKRKCVRGYYKKALLDAIRKAGHPATLGGIEFAEDLVAAMHFYAAAKADTSLGAFLTDMRAALRSLAAEELSGGIHNQPPRLT